MGHQRQNDRDERDYIELPVEFDSFMLVPVTKSLQRDIVEIG